MTKFVSLMLLILTATAAFGLVYLAQALPTAWANFQEQPEDLYIIAIFAGVLLMLCAYWGYGCVSILLQHAAAFAGVVYFASCMVATLGLLFAVMGVARPADQLFGLGMAVVCLSSAIAIAWFTRENKSNLI